jgi:hypothetical protein
LPGHNIPNVPSKLLNKAAEAMCQVMNGSAKSTPTEEGKYNEYSFDEFSFVIEPTFLSK